MLYIPHPIGSAFQNYSVPGLFLAQGKFTSPPQILVTAEHMVKDQKHDAATSWIEEVTPTSFKVCLRELQDFDGLHSKIYVVSRQRESRGN